LTGAVLPDNETTIDSFSK